MIEPDSFIGKETLERILEAEDKRLNRPTRNKTLAEKALEEKRKLEREEEIETGRYFGYW